MATGKYKDWLAKDKLALLQGWRRDGLSYEQIAKNIGVKRQTLLNWYTLHKEIREALKKGEEVCIYETENAMYKAAVGYDIIEQEIIETTTPDGEVTKTVRKRSRHYPPNLGAICFILKNRRPNKWQDKPTVIDTTALDKLDSILKEAREAAESEAGQNEAAEEEIHGQDKQC